MKVEIKKTNRINVLLICLGISILTAFFLLILIVLFSLIAIPESNWSMTVNLTLPTFLALYLIPRFCVFFLSTNKNDFNMSTRTATSYFVFLSLFSFFLLMYAHFFGDQFDNKAVLISLIIHFLVVSIGEEYIYRNLILNTLRRNYNNFLSIMISALMFAFVLHSNEDFSINLLVRFPLGILFGLIAVKTKDIKNSVLAHTIYNLLLIAS
ncbi:CPBP family intramembrane glutamic endopeptidase [Gottfriedia sp. NPDC058432]|uniref:CPBP family intramembrane glutamic endopeptidase n=1 Tax=Gottfriedia sp. NPDC058432 TaxID=3346497 RepID=UPI00365CF26A